MMRFLRNLARRFALPSVQLFIAALIMVVSTVLTLSVMLRFVPILDQFAIGRDEPFWVLLLSVLALLFAGYTALPAALAYKEVKASNDG